MITFILILLGVWGLLAMAGVPAKAAFQIVQLFFLLGALYACNAVF